MKLDLTTNQSRNFGVEFEFYGNRQASADMIRNAGVDCQVEGYNHFTRNHWKIVTDASLGANGAELVSPILNGKDGIRAMRTALEALETSPARVNRACGFHVHVDTADLTDDELRKLVLLWSLCEDCLESLLSPSRRGRAQYCKSIASCYVMSPSAPEEFNQADKAIRAKIKRSTRATLFGDATGHDRYYKLNLQHVATRGTIEIRAHQGTICKEKAEAWVKLSVALVEAAKYWSKVNPRASKKTGRDRLSAVLSYLGVQGVTRKFLLKRAREIEAANRRTA